jgi:CRP-like cAMP-binding protein
MVNNFTRYLLEKENYTEAELLQIAKVTTVVDLTPGEILFTEGSLWPYNGFVCGGLLINFTLDGLSGNEKIVSFAPEMFWAGDRNALLTGTAMPHSARALETTRLVLIEHSDLENLRFKIQRFNDMMNLLIQKFIEVTTRTIMDNMIFSDEEKYANLISKIPTLNNRVPRHMIASCLNITHEGLDYIIDGMPWKPSGK